MRRFSRSQAVLHCWNWVRLYKLQTLTTSYIADLASAIAKTLGYDGGILFDASIPDDAPRKRMDSSRLKALDRHPEMGLSRGLQLPTWTF